MTIRGTVVLLAVVAGLAAAVWMAGSPFQPPSTSSHLGSQAPLLPPGIQVVRVTVEHNGVRVVAQRSGSGWTVPGISPHPGDTVDSLLEVLRTVGPLMTIEEAPARPEDYGIGRDATRLLISGDGENPLLDLTLGRYNPSWTGFYARLADRPAIVLIGAVVRWEVEKLRRATGPAPDA